MASEKEHRVAVDEYDASTQGRSRVNAGRRGMRVLGAATALAIALSVTACGVLSSPSTGLACQQPATNDTALGQREVPPLIGLRPDVAAARLHDAGIPVSWRYSYTTNPPSRADGYSECWCIAPPDGVVANVAAEPAEQLIVMVERPTPMRGGRPQPTQGWGCDEA